MAGKKLTKVLAGIAGTAMLAAMPVYAENTGNNDHITVNYSQVTTYMLHIPDKIDLSSTETKQVTGIGVSAVNTTPTEKVQVKIKEGITANNQVELTRENDSNTKVVSDVTDYQNKKVSNGDVVAEFQDMSTVPVAGANTNVLNFSAVKDSAGGTVKAGSYSGTIVFVADVVADTPETSETF